MHTDHLIEVIGWDFWGKIGWDFWRKQHTKLSDLRPHRLTVTKSLNPIPKCQPDPKPKASMRSSPSVSPIPSPKQACDRNHLFNSILSLNQSLVSMRGQANSNANEHQSPCTNTLNASLNYRSSTKVLHTNRLLIQKSVTHPQIGYSSTNLLPWLHTTLCCRGSYHPDRKHNIISEMHKIEKNN